MSSSEEDPIFEAIDTLAGKGTVQVPKHHHYIGTISENDIGKEMPCIYLDIEVASALQSEAQRSIATDKEVAGILLGTTSPDTQVIKVSHIAIARDEDSSPVHFKFTYSVWDDLIDQMEEMSRKVGHELLLLGWYHTHPNMAVFLSRYDLRTHRDFHRPYQFALVLAPRSGTPRTQVGFFVNRNEGTPLLPGLRLFGALPNRKEVASRLPWNFQDLEADGVYEGEGDDDDVADGDSADDRTEIDTRPVVHQLGVVRREAPEWLTLGYDPAEGCVLPILEKMAAAVVADRSDRMGVLLGTKNKKNHITITRVRFLGSLSADASNERQELVTTLGFMANNFPAHEDPKILGLVRLVAPHRFKTGDSFAPLENNIRITELLREVGYDTEQAPFQVGLVLYPGFESDCIRFQVFAQHKASRPVPLMSLQALAPASRQPNEYYDSVEGEVFEVEEVPECSLNLPGLGDGAGQGPPTQVSKPLPRTESSEFPSRALQTGSGIDWDEPLPDEEAGAEPEAGRRGPQTLIGICLVLVLLVVGALVVVSQRTEQVVKQAEEASIGGAELEELLAIAGEPYEYSLVGCGSEWTPGEVCRPFGSGTSGRVELVRVQRLPAYTEATIQPIEAWLLPRDHRPRLRLHRNDLGDGQYSFSVHDSEDGWTGVWEDGGEFAGRVVLLPRGAELLIEDELSALRRHEDLEFSGPASLPVEVAAGRGAGEAQRPRASTRRAGSAWIWKSGATAQKVSYDVSRQNFAGPLLASGSEDPSGEWEFSYRERKLGGALLSYRVSGLAAEMSKVDLGREVTDLMRTPDVIKSLERMAAVTDAVVYVRVQPPGGSGHLDLQVPLSGAAASSSVRHKVCIMLGLGGGESAEGTARVGAEAEMRPSFAPGECTDGGGTARWSPATFGPGPAQLEWVSLGSTAGYEAAKGKMQISNLGSGWSRGAAKCLAITVHVGNGGWQAKAPTVRPLYELRDGRCQ